MGMLGIGEAANPVFQSALDVPKGGVLVLLPALLANGLLDEVDGRLLEPRGYYSLSSLLILLSFLVAVRLKTWESLRYETPGEWGRLLGLDRIPEVKTLRRKMGDIATASDVVGWAEAMGRRWMKDDPELAGILYVDGHVRPYYGSQTRMPERFSSRDRLCVRSLMDYWVNDRDGKPFFVVTAMGTEGMLHHLRTEIVPRLLIEVPNQPTEAELAADPTLHRFILVFDREGWSPAFFQEMWTRYRIAIISYRKGNYQPWPHSDFHRYTITLPHGNQVEMDLAERQADDLSTPEVTFREIRRLRADLLHQTPLITTCQKMDITIVAVRCFARWSQENFLHYATAEMAIDRLVGYLPEAAPETAEVRNPAWRDLDQRVRRLRAERHDIQARIGRLNLYQDDDHALERFLTQREELTSQLNQVQQQLDDLNAQKRAIPRRVPLKDLPEDQRPRLISPRLGQLTNVIKITVYRAETALANILRDHISRPDQARSLAKDIFHQTADLLYDPQLDQLTVRLHHATNPQAARAVHQLLQVHNTAEVVYPGTKTRLKYELVSTPIPGGREV